MRAWIRFLLQELRSHKLCGTLEKKKKAWTSLVVQWLRSHASIAEGTEVSYVINVVKNNNNKTPKPLFILLIASGHGAQMFPTRERCLPLFSKKDGYAVLYNLKGRYSQLYFPDEKYCGSRKPGDLLGQTGCYWWNQSSHPGGLSSWPSSFYPASVFNQS